MIGFMMLLVAGSSATRRSNGSGAGAGTGKTLKTESNLEWLIRVRDRYEQEFRLANTEKRECVCCRKQYTYWKDDRPCKVLTSDLKKYRLMSPELLTKERWTEVCRNCYERVKTEDAVALRLKKLQIVMYHGDTTDVRDLQKDVLVPSKKGWTKRQIVCFAEVTFNDGSHGTSERLYVAMRSPPQGPLKGKIDPKYWRPEEEMRELGGGKFNSKAFDKSIREDLGAVLVRQYWEPRL